MLPTDVTSKAFRASNGELAWRREDIEQAIAAIRDAETAILGGEVWLITGLHSWNGLIPRRDAEAATIWQWETGPQMSNESWQKYCERTATESIEAVQTMAVEQETPPSLIDHLRFNVTFIDR